jgi:hypothetical protein
MEYTVYLALESDPHEYDAGTPYVIGISQVYTILLSVQRPYNLLNASKTNVFERTYVLISVLAACEKIIQALTEQCFVACKITLSWPGILYRPNYISS